MGRARLVFWMLLLGFMAAQTAPDGTSDSTGPAVGLAGAGPTVTPVDFGAPEEGAAPEETGDELEPVDFSDPAAAAEPVVEDEAGKRVYLIPITTEITDITLRRVESAIEKAKADGCDVIVFEMDTPGGGVGAAVDICRAIRDLTDVHTVAWVHREAISAGAMISVACDEIIIAPMSKIGDCAPIMIGPEGMQPMGDTEREKISTYIRSEFREASQRVGYPEALCDAMVMRTTSAIYEIWHARTGEVRFIAGHRLTDYGLVDPMTLTVPQSMDEVNAKASMDWRLERLVLDVGQLLTMLTQEAVDYGFAKPELVADEAALAAYTGASNGVITRVEETWSESLAMFLTSPVVRGLLTVVFLLGFYAEINSPGLGFPGVMAVVALLILLGAPYVTGLANWIEVVMILLGVALLLVEMFVIPGFGVAGVAGLVLVFVGMVMTFVPSEGGGGTMPSLPELQGTWDAMLEGMLTMMISLVVAMIGFFVIGRYIGSIPFMNRLVLGMRQQPATVAPMGESIAAAQATAVGMGGTRVGDTGVVSADLRPVGRARFGDALVDVVTQGEQIESGATVRVVEVHGNRVVVEEA
ncbi:MAG: hypothetical protein CMJ49_07760 [Planctomycetaceae bacterium]|nr:hypothetical protein [Planctomycetaceae bacterium]